MPNKKMSKREKDIKGKLMAAIAMLLVSSIMMVSTTYAWFTLSTAPEVTGIQTAVGANGNLEMALLPSDGSTPAESKVGDSNATIDKKNITWGNLVDVSRSDIYGMDKIILNPSQLTVTTADPNGNPTQINTTNFVAYPEYGSDGRVFALSRNAVTATYSADGFLLNRNFGVRAVGVASGMTDRQLAYRNAAGDAATAVSQAKTAAADSLKTYGNSLGNIAIKKATDSETYTQDDVAAINGMISTLETNVLPKIETAYMQYILAYAASAANTNANAEAAWKVVAGMVTADGAHLVKADANDTTGLLTKTGSGDDATYALTVNVDAVGDVTLPLPDKLNECINKLEATKANVTTAKTEAAKLTGLADSALNWGNISAALTPLANPDAMKVNGKAPSDIKANMGEFASDVMNNGLTIAMHSGGGVYADVADHCGNYDVNVMIRDIKYGEIELGDMNARMETQSDVSPSYLSSLSTAVSGAGVPSSAGAQARPMTETYGYIIDLAFRTNAATSNLLLQAEAADRIYSDNNNADTMGHGATMTFKAVTPDFTEQNVKDLMANIKIVFFDPDTGNVYATAKLDTTTATSSTEGVTAKMYIYTISATVEYEAATYAADSGLTYYTKSTELVYEVSEDPANAGVQLYTKNGDTYTAATYDASITGMTYYVRGADKDVYTAVDDATAAAATEQLYTAKTTGTATEVKSEDNKIVALTQNTAKKVSMLVYLDGETITNADVAATANKSVTGTMNLQFSSSAELVPMEYGNLHITDGEETTESTAADNSDASGESTGS